MNSIHIDRQERIAPMNTGETEAFMIQSVYKSGSGKRVTITFINDSTEVIRTYWHDWYGNPIRWWWGAPGASYNQVTYASHPWSVTANDDPKSTFSMNGMEVFITGEEDEVVHIKKVLDRENPILEVWGPIAPQWIPHSSTTTF